MFNLVTFRTREIASNENLATLYENFTAKIVFSTLLHSLNYHVTQSTNEIVRDFVTQFESKTGVIN